MEQICMEQNTGNSPSFGSISGDSTIRAFRADRTRISTGGESEYEDIEESDGD